MAQKLRGQTGHLRHATGRLNDSTGHLFRKTGRLHGQTGDPHQRTGRLRGSTGHPHGRTGRLHGSSEDLGAETGRLHGLTGDLHGSTGRLADPTGSSGGTIETCGRVTKPFIMRELARHPSKARMVAIMLHAEANLCSLFTRGNVKLIACTTKPCTSCAQMLCAYGVKEIYYHEDYPDSQANAICDLYGVAHTQLID